MRKEVVMNNILVCDDDKDIVKIISVYLTNEGYNVKTAYNGREALDADHQKDEDQVKAQILDYPPQDIATSPNTPRPQGRRMR